MSVTFGHQKQNKSLKCEFATVLSGRDIQTTARFCMP
jgi:hypothetical protein